MINNIFCVGRNYVEHVRELNNSMPDQPVIFSKPTHSMVTAEDNRVDLPADKGAIHYETELVIKMGKDYTPNCPVDELVNEMTIGLDLTLRDLQQGLKDKQYPWLLSKGFPNSAILGKFIPFPGLAACRKSNFSLQMNHSKVQDGNIDKMIFALDTLVQFIGNNLGLKAGDIIFTGTPSGVGALKDDDELKLTWGMQELGACVIHIDE